MKPSEILSGAIEILETYQWTQGNYAINHDGDPCDIDADAHEACAFCAQGALMRAAGNIYVNDTALRIVSDALDEIVRCSTKSSGIVSYNDSAHTTKEDVLNVLKEALNNLDLDDYNYLDH